MKFIKGLINLVMDGLETVVFVSTLYIIIYIYLFQPSAVNGASMEPNFYTGDRVITSKIAYKLNPIERGDVVVVESPKNTDIQLFKRIIGLPGDIILVKDGEVFVNGKKITDNFTSSATTVMEGYVREGQEFIIPENTVFVMGDNRNRSLDSRSFGPVPISTIIGKAIFRYYPFDRAGRIENYLQ